MTDSQKPTQIRRGRSPANKPAKDVDTGSEGRSKIELSNRVRKELEASARPGQGDTLVKVFGGAVAAYADGDLDEALRLGERSKQIALRSTSVREFLGLAYYAVGRWKEAARELAAFRRMTGSTAQNHVIADCYRAMERPDKALEFCDEVAREVGDDVYYECQIVAAGALTDMDQPEDAIARLLRLDLKPKVAEEHHLRAWYVLGDLLERLGRFTQARTWFDSVATADPELTDAAERSARLSGQG